MRYFYADADRRTIGPVTDGEVFRASHSMEHLCRQCDAPVKNGTLWCPRCNRSTLAHVDARLASPLKRLAAQCIDWITPSFGTALIATYSVSAASVLSKVAIVAWAIWSMMLFSNGMTPGKWMVGIYVIDRSGDTATFLRMVVREFIGKMLSFLVFGLGFVWILVDDENQGWHDKLVDTYVVED
ncbi:MAG TPA: RDD family protein [Gemmatimonadaceae bacterium]|jgi:uncharacterized RDD family membrane protein YckC